VSCFRFLCSGFSFSLLVNIFHSITATPLRSIVNSYILPTHHSSLSLALISHYTTSSFAQHLQDVLSRRRKILGLPVPLLRAQRRYVRRIWYARPPNTREDRPRRLRLRETLESTPTSILGIAGRVFRLWLRNSKPLIASTLVPAPPQMKRAVFDDWLLMAIATSCALRVRAMDTISLLISGEDFFGAPF
jgi:hypothetical protein